MARGIIILILMITCMCGCNGPSSNRDETYPPPGVLYDVGGYKLHLQCTGSGTPAVVMEAGAGDFSLTWALVAPTIALTNQVCVYDRAGLGWSEPSPNPRLAGNQVAELHALLQKAGIAPPYLLVAHSMGGVLARVFAHVYPAEMAGLVLVDPSHEEETTRQEPDVRASMDALAASAMAGLADYAARSAEGTLTPAEIEPMVSTALPAKEHSEYAFILRTRPAYWDTLRAEGTQRDQSYADVKNMGITSLGDLPLVVIRSSTVMQMAQTAELSAKADAVLRALQLELSQQSSRGSITTAADTTHEIQLVKPQAVIDAINSVRGMAGR
jgi:pimeloyl-ACP methyl ester carboxylesterase